MRYYPHPNRENVRCLSLAEGTIIKAIDCNPIFWDKNINYIVSFECWGPDIVFCINPIKDNENKTNLSPVNSLHISEDKWQVVKEPNLFNKIKSLFRRFYLRTQSKINLLKLKNII